MKFLMIIFIPMLCFSQEKTFPYLIKGNTIEVTYGSDVIKFDFDTEEYSFKDITMGGNIFHLSDNEEYECKGNSIYINSKEYRFKRPWLSKKTFLVDENNVKLLELKANYADHNFVLKENEAFNSLSTDEELKQKLLLWTLFNQSQYVHYNHEDMTKYIVFGALVGAVP